MGNTPSTSKSADSTPPNVAAAHQQSRAAVAHEASLSPRASKKEPKNLISAHQYQHRSTASSPEASVVTAQGSTIGSRNPNTKPLSILNSSSPSASGSENSTARSSVSRQARHSEDKNEPSKPVAVPAASHHDTPTVHPSDYCDDPILVSNSISDMSSYMARPPRLPLPIEEEVHTPGSPIIAPADIGEPVDSVEGLNEEGLTGLPRRASGLSNGTDEDDAEELRVDKSRPTVPTRIEWVQGGQKVYVTGTPFNWSRKQRLLPAKGRENVLEAIIPVYPGTHHIKFLVDGSMEISQYLPTTVDFGNNLVNYIEVSGEDIGVARSLTLGATPPKTAREAAALPSRVPSRTHLADEEAREPAKKDIPPPERFSGHLPRYLADFDQPEDTKPYQLSVAAIDKLPMPPALPGFLSKPILNNTTLIKDDNSVLNMPNHTVLNHLGTSSIKNNVLAVSATTRYKNKYVTTIIYKPTSEDN